MVRIERVRMLPSRSARLVLGAVTLVAGSLLGTAASADGAAPADGAASLPAALADDGWNFSGQNVFDTHSTTGEHAINADDVGQLGPRWTFTAGGSVSATPTVARGVVYVPDWAGDLYAVDAHSGHAIWTDNVPAITGVAGDVSRVSPAYWNGELVTGDRTVTATGGAEVFAVDARTGALLWKNQVDGDPYALITASPVISDGIAYIGVSSRSETAASSPTFRGSVVALDARTGALLWKTYIVPDGYTGGAVWGSNPVVDPFTGLVYVGTGNNYTTPPGVCTMPDQTGCTLAPADNYIDSVVAMNLRTGAVVWSRPTLTADTWTLAQRYGPDFDFGTGPNLFRATIGGKRVDLLGIGQKSGVYWALDPADGHIVWATAVGPGGALGGIEWGTATDSRRIYVAVGNTDNVPFTLQGSGPYAGQTITGGSWSALDPATGAILWQTPDPQGAFVDDGMLSVANGVLYGGSLAPTGDNMYALDTATGVVEWGYPSGGAVLGGPAIVDGTVYWGSGYHTQWFPPPLGYFGDNNKLFAFSLPHRD
jgi:polyvinyl alcohol dehydrogenase (cytochrome)